MTTPPHFSKKTPVLLQSPDFNFLPVIAKNNIYQQPHAHNMCYKITQQTFFANHKLLFIYKKLRKKNRSCFSIYAQNHKKQFDEIITAGSPVYKNLQKRRIARVWDGAVVSAGTSKEFWISARLKSGNRPMQESSGIPGNSKTVRFFSRAKKQQHTTFGQENPAYNTKQTFPPPPLNNDGTPFDRLHM